VTQIEAVHHSIPLVVTDIPGARMLVKESGFGAVAETENPKNLARAIIDVMSHRKNYLTFHKKALQFLHAYDVFHLD
jgi:glycosyltransferase involved in cell wall biosynthesis